MIERQKCSNGLRFQKLLGIVTRDEPIIERAQRRALGAAVPTATWPVGLRRRVTAPFMRPEGRCMLQLRPVDGRAEVLELTAVVMPHGGR